MAKYHIAKKGGLAACGADVRDCPLGNVEHFEADTPEAAQKMFEESMTAQHGLIATVKSKSMTEDDFIEKYGICNDPNENFYWSASDIEKRIDNGELEENTVWTVRDTVLGDEYSAGFDKRAMLPKYVVTDEPNQGNEKFLVAVPKSTLNTNSSTQKDSVEKLQEIRNVQDLRDELEEVEEKKRMVDVLVDAYSDPEITDDQLAWNLPPFPESVRNDIEDSIASDNNDPDNLGYVESLSTPEKRAYQLDLLHTIKQDLDDSLYDLNYDLDTTLAKASIEDREVLLRPTPKKQVADSVLKTFDSHKRTGLAFKSKQDFFEESNLSATDFSHGWKKLVQDARVGGRSEAVKGMGLVFTENGVARQIGKTVPSVKSSSNSANSMLMRAKATPVQNVRGETVSPTVKWVGSVEQHFDNPKIGEKPSTRNCPHNHRTAVAAEQCSQKMLAKLKVERGVPSTMTEKEHVAEMRRDPWS